MATPPDRQARELATRGAALLSHALRSGSEAVLRTALSTLDAAAQVEAAQPGTLANLGAAWRTGYRWGLEPDGLAHGIRALRRAVALTPDGDAARPGRIANLGVLLRDDYDRDPRPSTLDEAIELLTTAAHDPRASAAQRAEWAGNLAIAVQNRYERTYRREDLDEAVRLGRLALDPAAGRNPDGLASSWNNLAGLLAAAFAESGDLADLDEAVTAADAAVAQLADGHAMRGHYQVTAGQLRTLRYDTTGVPVDRERALELLRAAVASCPPGAGWLALAHTALGAALFRGAYTGAGTGSLATAIHHFRVALEATAPASAAYAGRVTNLATVLAEHFVRSGERDSLDAALSLHAAAADTVDDLATRASILSSYAESLIIAFHADGAPDHLAQAKRLAREALSLTGRRKRERVTASVILARVLRAASLRDGGAADLNEAIDLLRRSLAGSRAAGAERLVLEELSSALRLRFDRLGELEDLDEAITAGHRLLDRLAADDLRRVDVLARLSLAVRRRASRDQSADSAAEMVALARRALSAVPTDAPAMRGTLEANLGAALRERAELTGSRADLDEAVTVLKTAAERAGSGSPEVPIRLCDVGTALRQRAAQLGDPDLLNQAIATHRRALREVIPQVPEHATVLHNLAGSLRDRYVRSGAEADRTESLALLRRAAATSAAPTPQRFDSAHTCARLAADTGQWAVAAEAYATAIRLLQVTLWHGLERSAQLDRLEPALWMAADAAACALRAGDVRGALRVLEAGRGVLWQQRVEADASLRAAGDDGRLRDRLLAARAVLDRDPEADEPITARDFAGLVHADVAEGRRRYRREERLVAARAWDEAARSLLRQRRGATRPPRSGTVVLVVASRHGCYAILRTRQGMSALQLTGLRLDELADVLQAYLQALDPEADPGPAQRAVTEMLAWLWRTVVEPVLRQLGHGPSCRHTVATDRIWWCATGPLALFPLHAAGDGRTPAHDALDHVVSSYTPTVAALRGAPRTRRQGPARMIAVSAPRVAGARELRYADAEIAAVAMRLSGLALTDAITGPDATPPRVLDGLRDHQLAHLACHGEQDTDQPSRAGLLLVGGRLTVDDLARHRLPASIELAYLSACQTAWSGLRLGDEALHLAAALYYTGCRHVIAALWPILDRLGPMAAAHVYQHLGGTGVLRVDDAAHAVHSLTLMLRRKYAQTPSQWAAFVHYGR